MNLKRSPFAIQDKNTRDLDNAKDYPTIADLMREQKVSNDEAIADVMREEKVSNDEAIPVHHRRDLDSLG